MYRVPHQTDGNLAHTRRVAATIRLGRRVCATYRLTSGADLSCGDGRILAGLPLEHRMYGDYARGWPIKGPIERTIGRIEPVDLFVCSETIEHLYDPAVVLGLVAAKAEHLLLSTPVGCFGDTNPEHVWAWDRGGVEQVMQVGGFRACSYVEVNCHDCSPYIFGVWHARRVDE